MDGRMGGWRDIRNGWSGRRDGRLGGLVGAGAYMSRDVRLDCKPQLSLPVQVVVIVRLLYTSPLIFGTPTPFARSHISNSLLESTSGRVRLTWVRRAGQWVPSTKHFCIANAEVACNVVVRRLHKSVLVLATDCRGPAVWTEATAHW